MRAALYLRVSTEEQAMGGYSLDAQEEKLLMYCQDVVDDLEVYKIYRDEGFSGRNIRRPAYAQMMEERDNWDLILVLKMDRIHRNTRNFMKMMDDLASWKKEFRSATEDLDTTTAMGRFVVSMIQNIAQLESETIGERTKFGMAEKASTMVNTEAESRTMGFNPPYGYRLDEGLLEGIPEELDVIRRIFSEYSEGTSLTYLAESLNRDGIRTRKGVRWNKYNLRTILHNPIYAGYLRWGGKLTKHYAAVAVNILEFNDVQKLMASHSRNPNRRKSEVISEGDDEDKPLLLDADDFSDA